MLGLNLITLAELHYSIVLSFCLAGALFAFPYRQVNKRALHTAYRMLGVGLFVLIVKIWLFDISVFKTVMMAECVFYAFNAGAELLPNKKNSYEGVSMISMAVLVVGAIIMVTQPLSDTLFELNLRWIATGHIGFILVDASLKLLKHRKPNVFTPHVLNVLGSLTIIFMFTVNGLFFLVLFKIGYFVSTLYLAWLDILAHHKASLDRAAKIEKDFDNQVRKEVNEKLFYMELSKERIAHKARTDDMTGALNKKALIDEMDKLLQDKRTHTYSILMFDIDKFKLINDNLGHIVGDQCIKQLARIAMESIRDKDQLGRYGGDEFFILLPKADLRTAVVVAERFRQKVEKTNDPHFTVSIGIANYPEDGATTKDLIHHADEGLYISKENGRNRVSYKKK